MSMEDFHQRRLTMRVEDCSQTLDLLEGLAADAGEPTGLWRGGGGLPPAVIVGHSYGGTTAIAAGASRGPRKALVR